LLGTDTYSDQLSNFTASTVVEHKDHTASWKVERTTRPLWLGNQTGDAQLLAIYRDRSADLQAFLADRGRATYDARFELPRTGSPAGIVVIGLFSLLLAYFGFRWWRGWYAELEVAGDEIIIRRRPMFFTGPRELRMPMGDLVLSEHVEKRYLGKGQSAKFALFELRTREGKRVFKYTTMYDQKSRGVLDGYMQLLGSHISRG
jgi:hypothetical protein